ncbi:hypothetical protein ACH5RR_036952 [Cinchona calisaya]|uniref:Uncharacterized protein n=1 Tax=Cinchona calisaya TaxID=153742 RepID=A0ABD2YA68_9GENT
MTSVDNLDQDPSNQVVKQEDVEMEDNIRRLELLVIILRPLLSLNNLKSLKEDINKIVSLHNRTSVPALVTWEKAEYVVIFIDSLLQILKDITISEALIFVNPIKREIL